MTFSLGEVEALARKAARGAGYPWGLAEEAGFATRWLCANSLDGCGALLRVLARFDRADRTTIAPRPEQRIWTASGGRLCPLFTGARLSDLAQSLLHGPIYVGAIAEPLLLLPFAGQASVALQRPVALSWDGGGAMADGHNAALDGAGPDRAETVVVSLAQGAGTMLARSTRAPVSDSDWVLLSRFAERTYAPASEASRRMGAGASGTDND